MSDSILLERLKGGEGPFMEFVSDIHSVERIARHVSAFLNSDSGGTIICGVDDKGYARGIPEPEAAAGTLQRKLGTIVSPPGLFSVAIEAIDDVSVIVLEVPSGSDRPYVTGGGVWLRKGAKTIAADAPALRALFAEQANEPERWERRLSPSLTVADLSESQILRLRDEARRSNRFDFGGDEAATEVLDRLALTRPGGFTQGADVLFATDPTTRHPQARVQLVVFERDETSDDYLDLRWFQGPLLEIADAIIEALMRYNPIGASFKSGEIEREDLPGYARFALREGVVNALAHRDYSSYSGSVRISVFPSRIEIWNSGRLPEGIRPEDLPRKHPSVPTNPDIARAFYLRRLMDQVGRGGQRLAEACKEIGARPPEWAQAHGGVLLTLHAALGREQARAELLNDRQRNFVDSVEAGATLTLGEYRDRFAPDVSDRQARRDLNELETYRFLRREGAGRSTVYRRRED
ncbi:RNA-binding domain-containing protein [Sphingosinicella rhizophila]|uniref:ATP-binding protein n=1 Tax=Sphingosinicella rhizophila TaxID=3050082 RepID=A0ABU3Q5E4_9SPHN|nr:RNA-binding domain-containing protein [Sphingosinicella sp. GR2756]MDT9598627.1 ATP-binding protein [Sphingosinicella sp. GR2756]